MWHTLSETITPAIAVGSGLLALLAAWLKLRPHRIFVWLAAVKERETLLAMWEHAQGMADHWQQEAERCHQALKDRCP